MKKTLPPVHPGEVLCEEFLTPMSLGQNRLALGISVPARRINEIVATDAALRLTKSFGTSADFWLGLQAQ